MDLEEAIALDREALTLRRKVILIGRCLCTTSLEQCRTSTKLLSLAEMHSTFARKDTLNERLSTLSL